MSCLLEMPPLVYFGGIYKLSVSIVVVYLRLCHQLVQIRLQWLAKGVVLMYILLSDNIYTP